MKKKVTTHGNIIPRIYHKVTATPGSAIKKTVPFSLITALLKPCCGSSEQFAAMSEMRQRREKQVPEVIAGLILGGESFIQKNLARLY